MVTLKSPTVIEKEHLPNLHDFGFRMLIWLVVEPTRFKNMTVVKLEVFPILGWKLEEYLSCHHLVVNFPRCTGT